MTIDWKSKLYNRGFLFTNQLIDKMNDDSMPIQNWKHLKIKHFNIYVHPLENVFIVSVNGTTHVLIGHAYNPFLMIAEESKILQQLAECYMDEPKYRELFDQITGVFVYIVIQDTQLVLKCDCAGMMGAYYAQTSDNVYVSSHAQLIADFLHVQEDPYISNLKHSKTFHLYGLYLPYDHSPYKEIKRVLPNVEVSLTSNTVQYNRFYPREEYSITANYDLAVEKAATILHNTMVLIAQKWEKPAISLTGGTDSKTTLACAGDIQDRFLYYSYISLPRERTDACAARNICNALNLKHEIYEIQDLKKDDEDFIQADALVERHYGYLGKGNYNDICKRIGLLKQFHADIEVKSWVSEIARASRYTKYHKKKLPKEMTPRILTSMYKVFTFDRKNALATDKVFADYLDKTVLADRIKTTGYPWSEFFVWEIVFGGWGGLALSGEHKISNNITVPYNNRDLLDLMLRTPFEKRITDQLHRDIMDHVDPRINALGIHVINGNETRMREILEGLYFDIHRRISF